MRTKRYIQWSEIHALIDRVASMLRERVPRYSAEVDAIYAVPRGGIVPAGMLSYALNVQTVTSTLHAESADLRAYRCPIIVEDIIDTGTTFNRLRKRFPKVEIVTLYSYQYNLSNVLVGIHIPCASKLFDQRPWLVFPWAPNDS